MKITKLSGLFLILGMSATAGYSAEVLDQSYWSVTGNSGTDPNSNFLGTTDTEDLVIQTDNTERVRINSRGRVGIGTDDPRQLLDVEISDHVTDSVSYSERLSHVTSGVPEQGFGAGLEFHIGGAGSNDAKLINVRQAKIEEKNLQLNHSFPDDIQVAGEKLLLEQAIANLLDNAIDFSEQGGEIKINASSQNGQHEITITDNGPGIPDYAKEKIFNRFFSLPRPHSQKRSTGLGLSFVREVITLHQGEVELKSTDANGVVATLSWSKK